MEFIGASLSPGSSGQSYSEGSGYLPKVILHSARTLCHWPFLSGASPQANILRPFSHLIFRIIHCLKRHTPIPSPFGFAQGRLREVLRRREPIPFMQTSSSLSKSQRAANCLLAMMLDWCGFKVQVVSDMNAIPAKALRIAAGYSKRQCRIR